MRHFLLGWVLCLPFFVSAQTFTTTKTTQEKAAKAYTQGITESRNNNFAVAQGYFEQALRADPNLIDAKLALADTYASMRDYFKAEKGFTEVLAVDTVYAPLAFFLLAKTEWELDKFASSAAHIRSYLRSTAKNEKTRNEARGLLQKADFAAAAIQHPVPFRPKSVGPGVNTGAAEYFPSLTADGQTLIFTRRTGGNEDFYQSTRKDSVWQTAQPLDDINTYLNEGAQAISPDGTWLVFTACNREGDGSQGSCDLYWSQRKNDKWTTPMPFTNSINSSAWEAQPTIGADNKTLIFTSSRPGTRGGYDLWQTIRQPGGKWGAPENLNINTNGKDHTPFLHPDGETLYFASDSLPGMGGNDIFLSRRQPDGKWSAPQNLGYPINTKGEEGMLVVSLDGRTAYFASDRPGGAGQEDIYSFELPENARPKPVTYARAKVTDAATGYPLVAKVDFIDLKTGLSFISANTRADGTAFVCLPAGKDYALNVGKAKYLFYSENFNLTETASFDRPLVLNIELQPIKMDTAREKNTLSPGKPVVLRNVFFETGLATLRPESTGELDRLTTLLTDSPTLRIQINGHTDHVGDDRSNLTLSENRAKAVYDYLIRKGISAARLRFKGFGETQPIESNDTEEGRSRNRRTEFMVW